MQTHVLEYLEKTAVALPEKAAVVDEGSAFTFEGLLNASQAIGSALLPLTVRGGFVAVLCERSCATVAAFLGVLQAGCCYVALDGKMPQARLAGILRQVQPQAVLFGKKDAKAAQALGELAPFVPIETAMGAEALPEALWERRAGVLDLDPAYVIFTSGSTGTPKGILISHRSVIDFADWLGNTCPVTSEDVVANQAPFYFDLSVKDLCACLCFGATMHILPKKYFMFPKLLSAYLNEHRVSALFWATSAFRMVATSGILERDPPRFIRQVVLGGEALQASHLNRWRAALPQARFVNLYGPTEVTVDCTYFPISRKYQDHEPIPIGKACKNMEILLLDEALSPVPPGEVGEICVRGTGLAIGYLGDPEKTAASFIQNPRHNRYPDRVYRTGDLAKYDREGNLLFMARKDDQIKHMGYRIELGEVETALGAVPGVEAAVCLFDKEKDQIVCFCQTLCTAGELSKAAKQQLPNYMVPNVWRMEQRLPATANGKIDRVKLRERYFEEN